MSDLITKPKLKQKLLTETSIPSFIKKIYEILEEKRFPEIIDWCNDGTALIIKNPMEFCHKVLPLYFKHNNLTSFIRQLNMYNFRKRRTQEMDHIYCHELFQRGKKHFLKDIKRKNHDPVRYMQKTMDSLDTTENHSDNNLASENQLLKSLNKDALARITSVEKKCKNLTSQNQALWHKVCGQQEREELLKGIVMALMKQFGVTTPQLPVLMKTYSHLFTSSNKLEKDEFMKELSSMDFSANFQDKIAANPLDLLKKNIEIPELKDTSHIMSQPANFLEFKPLENYKEQIHTNYTRMKNINGFPLFNQYRNLLIQSNNHQWNFAPDFLSGLGQNLQQTNNLLADKKESINSALLMKRQFDYENDDRQSFDSNCESLDSYNNGNWTVKKEVPTPAYYRESPKYTLLKNLKKEEFETHPKIELVEF